MDRKMSYLYCILIGLMVSCQSNPELLPYYNTPDFSPLFFEERAQALKKVEHKIANFSFSNQDGQNISEKDIEGKVHIANFMFTSCGSICPIMTENLLVVQEKFYNHPQFSMLSYSVTPWIDTPDKLRDYAQNQQITSDNWHLLTGKKTQIYDLARKSYFAEEDIGFSLDSTDFLHTEHILLVDQDKRIRGIYNGTLALEIKQLTEDIETLLEGF